MDPGGSLGAHARPISTTPPPNFRSHKWYGLYEFRLATTAVFGEIQRVQFNIFNLSLDYLTFLGLHLIYDLRFLPLPFFDYPRVTHDLRTFSFLRLKGGKEATDTGGVLGKRLGGSLGE